MSGAPRTYPAAGCRAALGAFLFVPHSGDHQGPAAGASVTVSRDSRMWLQVQSALASPRTEREAGGSGRCRGRQGPPRPPGRKGVPGPRASPPPPTSPSWSWPGFYQPLWVTLGRLRAPGGQTPPLWVAKSEEGGRDPWVCQAPSLAPWETGRCRGPCDCSPAGPDAQAGHSRAQLRPPQPSRRSGRTEAGRSQPACRPRESGAERTRVFNSFY